MTAGYTRQSSAAIQPGLAINANDINVEFNQVNSAFDNNNGHDHTGSVAGVGQKISLTAAVTGILPIANGGTGTSGITYTNPNKFINPFFEIDQVNEGAAVTTTANAYFVDGWIVSSGSLGGGTFSVQRAADAPSTYGFSGKLTITNPGVIAAGTALTLQQRLEADNLLDTGLGNASNNQFLTISFWVKSSVAGTYACSLRNAALNRSYVFSISVSTNWTQVSLSFVGDSTGTWLTSGSALAAYIDITMAVGSTFQATPNTWSAGNFIGLASTATNFLTTNGATFQIAAAKLELGTTVTPIVRASIQEELARCQRYYEKSYDLGTAIGSVTTTGSNRIIATGLSGAGNTGTTTYFKVTKRPTPNITTYSTGGTSGKVTDVVNSSEITPTLLGTGTNSFAWFGVPSSGNPVHFAAHWTADSRL